jgi:dihydroorotate dehydrogenase (NAD+) catalytic subunit
MAVDFRTRRSRLGSPTGGLSGPAIKPITLRLVWEVRRKTSIPILGLGGVEKAEDVLEYLLVGATAVQVGTASFTDPRASEGLVSDLERALYDAKVFSISEIHGEFIAESS